MLEEIINAAKISLLLTPASTLPDGLATPRQMYIISLILCRAHSDVSLTPPVIYAKRVKKWKFDGLQF